ncbi:mucin-5AC [Octopus bimaculoides]|nr:mucin-5AC [Octopus bimaculoides]|eukprot:XP_014786699.1 PREDICTED: mucin-5AC-like [Octopus bimaculoides]
MDQKKPNKNKRNPWFQRFWQEVFKCKLPSEKYNRSHHYNFGKVRLCTGKEDVAKYVNSVKTDAEHLSNAIMAFAQTLHNIHWDYCKGVPGICDAMKPLSGEVLSKYLESVRFKSMSGQVFEFHAEREPKAEYRLMNFQKISQGQYKWINLGKSRTKFSNETLRGIKFRNIEPVFPASFCSLPCEPGHIQISHSEEDCCFVCVPCPPDHYMPSERECIPCRNGTTPTLDHRGCVPSLSGNRKSTSAAERREPTNSTAEKVKQTTRRKKIPSVTKKAESERGRNESATNKLQYVSNETHLNYTLTNSSAENIETKNQTLDLEMDELAGVNETKEETESFPGKKQNEVRNKTKILKPNKNVKQKEGKNITMVSNSTSQNLTEETKSLPDENLQNNGTKARKNQNRSIDDINKNASKSAENSEKSEVLQTVVTTTVFLDVSSKKKSTRNSTETITKSNSSNTTGNATTIDTTRNKTATATNTTITTTANTTSSTTTTTTTTTASAASTTATAAKTILADTGDTNSTVTTTASDIVSTNTASPTTTTTTTATDAASATTTPPTTSNSTKNSKDLQLSFEKVF